MMKTIDLRSDTVTQQTEKMRKSMYYATVGDDILKEDPTVKELERLAAKMFGKEDGVFVSSGTMANQIAVMAFTDRGQEVIVGDTSHIYNLEVGGLAALSQVQARSISIPNGIYDIDVLESLIQTKGIQNPKTGLICIENTNNLNAGLVVPLNNIDEVCDLGRKSKIPIYMDGARIFNASIASKIKVDRIVKNVDAVMFALTKGLSAPFGAILLGDKEFVIKARWLKQRIGGGFRQAGFLAAPGIVALEEMIPQLYVDHKNAKLLGKELSKIEGLYIDTNRIHTNIMTCSIEKPEIKIENFIMQLNKNKIKVKKISETDFRMVTHRGIDERDIEYTIKIINDTMDNLL